MTNQQDITVELYESDGTTLLETTTTDTDGNYSFSTQVAGTYIVRVNNTDRDLPLQGNLLVNQADQSYSADTTTANFDFVYDTPAFTGAVVLEYSGDGDSDNPQVGGLYMPRDLKVVQVNGVMLDLSTLTYQWVDAANSDAVIVSHRGLPINVGDVGVQPSLLVDVDDVLGNSMTQSRIDIPNVVTKPLAITQHTYDFRGH